jgi:alginate O-acetyltransferase complex protein AlgI
MSKIWHLYPPPPDFIVDLILPIGLSFHTFQSLSYVIEVYRGNQKAEKHFGIYSLYVMFYPQLVTGPIERPQNLLVQLHEKKYFEYTNLINGLRLILFGLFIKMVIADNLGIYVDHIYNDPMGHNSGRILLGIFLYSFQIYGDFFGYSTIAVGCARTLGYGLMDNFKTPYSAKSLGEFWQRWHISFSSWFRDYVYLPLGGKKVSVWRWAGNILIVFVLSGIWHGANWTFVLWGLAHGLLYISGGLFDRFWGASVAKDTAFHHIITGFRVAKTFGIVSFVWILFRAENMEHVMQMGKALMNNWHVSDDYHLDFIAGICLLGFLIFDLVLRNDRFDQWCGKQHATVQVSIIILSSIFNFKSHGCFS